MHHSVKGDGLVELRHFDLVGEFAMQQQVADLEKMRMLRQLVDRIAAIKENALVAIDKCDVAFAACRRRETRIVSEYVRVTVQLADIEDFRAFRAAKGRKLEGFVFVSQSG